MAKKPTKPKTTTVNMPVMPSMPRTIQGMTDAMNTAIKKRKGRK